MSTIIKFYAVLTILAFGWLTYDIGTWMYNERHPVFQVGDCIALKSRLSEQEEFFFIDKILTINKHGYNVDSIATFGDGHWMRLTSKELPFKYNDIMTKIPCPDQLK